MNEWVHLSITGLAGIAAYLSRRAVSGLDTELSEIKEGQQKQAALLYEHGCSIERLEERTKRL